MCCTCCFIVLPLALAAAKTCALRSLAATSDSLLNWCMGAVAAAVSAASAAANVAAWVAVSVTAVEDAITGANGAAWVVVSVTAVADAITGADEADVVDSLLQLMHCCC